MSFPKKKGNPQFKITPAIYYMVNYYLEKVGIQTLLHRIDLVEDFPR